MYIYISGSVAQSCQHGGSRPGDFLLLPLLIPSRPLSAGTGPSAQEPSPERAAPRPAPPWPYCPQRAGTPAAREGLTGQQRTPTTTCWGSSWVKVGAAASHRLSRCLQPWCQAHMQQRVPAFTCWLEAEGNCGSVGPSRWVAVSFFFFLQKSLQDREALQAAGFPQALSSRRPALQKW